MKKIFLLGFLAVSSLLMSDRSYTFETQNTYCKNFDYDNIAMYLNEDNGTPYISIEASNCYHDGLELFGEPFRLFIDFDVPDFYEDVKDEEYNYFFYKDGSIIDVNETDDETQWDMRLNDGVGRFKNKAEYYSD